MKKLGFILSIAILSSCNTKNQTTYLGQKPPGVIPELFAPKIIKTKFRQAAGVFTPDLKEFYFRRRGGQYKSNALVVVKKEGNKWKESLVAESAGEPFITADGKTMHLGKRYREKTKKGWSKKKTLESLLMTIALCD